MLSGSGMESSSAMEATSKPKEVARCLRLLEEDRVLAALLTDSTDSGTWILNVMTSEALIF